MDGGRGLQADPDILECGLIAIQAVHRTLLDSGLDQQQVAALFGRAVSKKIEGHGGELVTSHLESRRLIRQLDLNSPTLIRWRVTWLRIVELARDRVTRRSIGN